MREQGEVADINLFFTSIQQPSGPLLERCVPEPRPRQASPVLPVPRLPLASPAPRLPELVVASPALRLPPEGLAPRPRQASLVLPVPRDLLPGLVPRPRQASLVPPVPRDPLPGLVLPPRRPVEASPVPRVPLHPLTVPYPSDIPNARSSSFSGEHFDNIDAIIDDFDKFKVVSGEEAEDFEVQDVVAGEEEGDPPPVGLHPVAAKRLAEDGAPVGPDDHGRRASKRSRKSAHFGPQILTTGDPVEKVKPSWSMVPIDDDVEGVWARGGP
ncbi:hypothetical protein DFP72DRAFT_1144135 [Ephemerocybe angulata]|uniref:Uncharacterized protein n=1 Tax=Ephemerocybe angulata TaxID=980116 RepID=A0A8H6HLR2_9AGAR|nr:hypothetical protein DFP72DRAFT_1144135 [Tulosesus angulatus]